MSYSSLTCTRHRVVFDRAVFLLATSIVLNRMTSLQKRFASAPKGNEGPATVQIGFLLGGGSIISRRLTGSN